MPREVPSGGDPCLSEGRWKHFLKGVGFNTTFKDELALHRQEPPLWRIGHGGICPAETWSLGIAD